jgi:hypothetical protein
MSSQGPKVVLTDTVAVNAPPILNVMPTTAALSAGYAFDKDSIRDAGDWIKYKKQLLVYKEVKTRSFTDPWFVHGNDYRLTWMQGQSKQPTAGTCTACTSGGAFVGDGPVFTLPT